MKTQENETSYANREMWNPSDRTTIHLDKIYIDALVNNNLYLQKEMYRKFLPSIQRMVVQNNGSVDDAYDLFQNALLSIFNKAKTGGFVLTCPFEAFLFTICKKRWITELKKRKSHRVRNIDSERHINIPDDNDWSVEAKGQARNDLIKEKLAELSESDRQLLEWHWS